MNAILFLPIQLISSSPFHFEVVILTAPLAGQLSSCSTSPRKPHWRDQNQPKLIAPPPISRSSICQSFAKTTGFAGHGSNSITPTHRTHLWSAMKQQFRSEEHTSELQSLRH